MATCFAFTVPSCNQLCTQAHGRRLSTCLLTLLKQVMFSQNPDTVKTREEVARLTRKLRTAEAELETKQSQAARQAANAEKLQEQLQEIMAGALQH